MIEGTDCSMNVRKRLLAVRARFLGVKSAEDLRRLGAQIGDRFLANGPVINPHDCPFITIGDRVTFGPSVMVLTHDAALRSRLGWTRVQPVVIEDKVFVGARSIILPGVRIGVGSIIGAGSVVNREVPAEEVWAGVPARRICGTNELADKYARQLEEWPKFREGWKSDMSDRSRREEIRLAVAESGGWFY